MDVDSRRTFFDNIAEQWDGWEDLAVLGPRLAARLVELGVRGDERVLEIGCGTGNLTRALLDHLSAEGGVVAVDLSPRMIAVACRKIQDPRVEWHALDARHLPLPAATIDRVICYSVWPHFDEHAAFAVEFGRVLRSGGKLHIWHELPRERVNEIHAAAGPAVQHDLLPPAQETAQLLEENGLMTTDVIDDTERYLVTAVKS